MSKASYLLYHKINLTLVPRVPENMAFSCCADEHLSGLTDMLSSLLTCHRVALLSKGQCHPLVTAWYIQKRGGRPEAQAVEKSIQQGSLNKPKSVTPSKWTPLVDATEKQIPDVTWLVGVPVPSSLPAGAPSLSEASSQGNSGKVGMRGTERCEAGDTWMQTTVRAEERGRMAFRCWQMESWGGWQS